MRLAPLKRVTLTFLYHFLLTLSCKTHTLQATEAENPQMTFCIYQLHCFYHQVLVVSAISMIMTVGVYGLVAAIVKLDDAGLYLLRSGSYKNIQHTMAGKIKRVFGRALLGFAPRLMHSLTIIGTIAMFLVGGSILTHGFAEAHHILASVELFIGSNLPVGVVNTIAMTLTPLIFDMLVGLLAGAIVLLAVSLFSVFLPRKKA